MSNFCPILRLTKNMHFQGSSICNSKQQELKKFANLILNIRDGKVGKPNDGKVDINIPNNLLIKDYSNLIGAITMPTYPTLLGKKIDKDTLCDSIMLVPIK